MRSSIFCLFAASKPPQLGHWKSSQTSSTGVVAVPNGYPFVSVTPLGTTAFVCTVEPRVATTTMPTATTASTTNPISPSRRRVRRRASAAACLARSSRSRSRACALVSFGLVATGSALPCRRHRREPAVDRPPAERS